MRRGFTVAEVLISMVMLAILIFMVGDAIRHTLRMEVLDTGRWSSARIAEQLSLRMSEEARSSTAVFIPHLDAAGGPNDPPLIHEVDFFRKSSMGEDRYTAYRFDAANKQVTREEYARLAGGGVRTIHSDVMATYVAGFTAIRTNISAADDVAGAQDLRPVSIYYGSPELAGGNDVVTVSFAIGAPGGGAPKAYSTRLWPRAAPTNLTVLVAAAAAPSGQPKAQRVIAFMLVTTTPVLVGGPGGAGLVPSQPQTVLGQALISGPDPFDWLGFYKAHPVVADGAYTFVDAQGASMLVSISCAGTPCPEFAPLPSAASADGRVVFKAVQ